MVPLECRGNDTGCVHRKILCNKLNASISSSGRVATRLVHTEDIPQKSGKAGNEFNLLQSIHFFYRAGAGIEFITVAVSLTLCSDRKSVV